jgi:hypothetical protein
MMEIVKIALGDTKVWDENTVYENKGKMVVLYWDMDCADKLTGFDNINVLL